MPQRYRRQVYAKAVKEDGSACDRKWQWPCLPAPTGPDLAHNVDGPGVDSRCSSRLQLGLHCVNGMQGGIGEASSEAACQCSDACTPEREEREQEVRGRGVRGRGVREGRK